MQTQRLWILVATAAIVSASCSGTSETDEDPESLLEQDVEIAAVSLSDRVDTIDDAVDVWRNATSVASAHSAAESALNLVVGPNGPGYGDRDGNGVVSGATEVGLLPGLDGTPTGLAMLLSPSECVARDILGGTWTEPGDEWNRMLTAIDEWRPDNNTMPTLPSHPMRVVGWATFTLASTSLDDAHEYAGHANLHVNITRRAFDC